MADTLVNTLYPPSMETFQPAFIYTDAASVTFALSPYNSASDIKYVHISVVDQRNNENVLMGFQEYNSSLGWGIYNGMILTPLPHSTTDISLIVYDEEKDLYGLAIPPAALKKLDKICIQQETTSETTTDENNHPITSTSWSDPQKYFNCGQYYKVQIRFDCNEEEDIVDLTNKSKSETAAEAQEASRKLTNYMVLYRHYFSEWSSVTLIKPILPLQITFPLLDQEYKPDEGESATPPMAFNKGLIRISAKVLFQDHVRIYDESDSQTSDKETDIDFSFFTDGAWEENEHLEKYKLTVTHKDNSDVILIDSGIQYAIPTKIDNSYYYGINYLLDLESLEEDNTYVLNVELWTNNNYYVTTTRIFSIALFNDTFFVNPIWHNRTESKYLKDNMRGYIEVNQEDGIAKIRFSCPTCQVPGVLYIKRASSKDNFKTWDVISITKHTMAPTVDIDDYTLCSLLRYRYSAQYEIKGGTWSKIWYSNIIYAKFYDMLLMRQNRQIAVRYNGQVTSLKPIVNRQKVDTLGGRYPKFVENAQMNYKQLQITGLISAEGDFNRKFLNEFDGEWFRKNEDEDWEYKYYYKDDLDYYDKTFGKNYLVRNDTDPDGEFGFNPKQATRPDNIPVGNRGNNYMNDERDFVQDGLVNDNIYAHSIFVEPDDINEANYYQHDLYPHDNWYWEREFREQLMAWLNDGEPKLFRSMPEGNIAVMLMDINLTPAKELGRRLYTFTATMYEIGDGYSLDSLDSLGIINVPKLAAEYVSTSYDGDTPQDDSSDSIWVEQVGQLWLPTLYQREMIKGGSMESYPWIWDNMTIVERLQQLGASLLRYRKINDKNGPYLHDVKIQFKSKPHWFEYSQENEGSSYSWKKLPEPELNNIINVQQIQDATHKYHPNKSQDSKMATLEGAWKSSDTLMLGYIIEINNEQIFVNERGYYQVPSDTLVTSIKKWNDQEDEIIIDYILRYQSSYDSSLIPKRFRTIQKIVGQWGGFMYPYGTSVGESIYKKYYIKKYTGDGKINNPVKFIQELQFWKGISVEVTPYAIIEILYQDATEYQQLLVGRTGFLSLFDDTPAKDLRFMGRKMFEVPLSRQPYLDEWEFVWDNAGSGSGSSDDEGPWPDYQPNWFKVIDLSDTGVKVLIYFGKYVQNREDATENVPTEDEEMREMWIDLSAEDAPDLLHPKYNTVYSITINGEQQYYIYYIDDRWYPIIDNQDEGHTITALVPVYGYINYHGNIVRSEYA